MRRLLLGLAAALVVQPALALELSTPPGSGGGGGGGVSSVGVNLPGSFTCTGSPVTSSGTITCSYVSEAANSIFVAPNGSSGVPSFRALVLADLPAIANNTVYGNISGGSAAPVALTASQVSSLLALGTAAGKNASGSGATVASTTGSFTSGHCLQAGDASGTVQDAGAACGTGGGGGSITGVTAGTGLSGGGTSGNVTVSLAAPIAVANGGTNAIAAGATAANNIGALAEANNLSDLVSASTARTNLGLGSAATQSTSAFLQPGNNLSDVASAATARTNLGLGTAAVKAASAAGGTVASTSGSFTTGDCLKAADSAGTVQDSGAACGSGGGGATIVSSGTGITVSGSPCSTSCTFSLSGVVVLNTRTVSSGTSDTASATDYTIAWNSASAAAKAESIPACSSSIKGQVYVIKDEAQNAATYTIAVTPASGTVEGAASAIVSSNGAALMIQCDGGSNWNAI
jgi:hypothetical protein